MTRNVVWKVLYEDWQMECCGTPFAVGDEVAWPLLLDEERHDTAWTADLSELEGPVEALATIEGNWSDEDEDEDEDEGDDGEGFEAFVGVEAEGDDEDFEEPFESSVVRDRGVTVPWNRPEPWPERARLTGLLTVERHGDRWPATAGRVRAIHVVTQEFAETSAGSRTYEPVPGMRGLRPVERCPQWFRREELPGEGRGRERGETGVLVELEVPGA